MSSLVPSIEGYDYALIIADDASMQQWVYGLKEKSEANLKCCSSKMDMLKITTQSATCMQILFIRDQAGELKSADLKEYIESLGVQNYWLMSNIRMALQNRRSTQLCV